MTLLELQGVSAGYGGVPAIRDISLHVGEGTITCVLGANGAGKSTLLKAIVGLAPALAGRIIYGGRDITRLPVHQAATLGITLSPEGRRLFPEMTVLENLRLGAYLVRSNRETLAHIDSVYDIFPRLKERAAQLAGSLSGGEQQMVAIARALMCQPRLLLLDEPSLGLAPKIIVEVARVITRVNEMGITVILVEQNARLALQLSQYSYVLESGRIAMEGRSENLLTDPMVQKVYLGLD